jgi:hypothetical protein
MSTARQSPTGRGSARTRAAAGAVEPMAKDMSMPDTLSRAACLLGAALIALSLASAPRHALAQEGGVVRMDPIPDRPRAQAPAAPQQQAFATPEAAIEGLIAAMRDPGTGPLARVLGQRVLDAIPVSERQGPELRRVTADQLARMPVSIDYLDAERTRARPVRARPQPAALHARPHPAWLGVRPGGNHRADARAPHRRERG